VDQNVEVAERTAGFGDHVLGVAGIADVGGHEAGLAERTRLGLAGGGVDVGDGDARPLGDVAPCDREPDAVRGTGDDGDLVLEPHAVLRKPRAYSGEVESLPAANSVLPSPLWGGSAP